MRSLCGKEAGKIRASSCVHCSGWHAEVARPGDMQKWPRAESVHVVHGAPYAVSVSPMLTQLQGLDLHFWAPQLPGRHPRSLLFTQDLDIPGHSTRAAWQYAGFKATQSWVPAGVLTASWEEILCPQVGKFLQCRMVWCRRKLKWLRHSTHY